MRLLPTKQRLDPAHLQNAAASPPTDGRNPRYLPASHLLAAAGAAEQPRDAPAKSKAKGGASAKITYVATEKKADSGKAAGARGRSASLSLSRAMVGARGASQLDAAAPAPGRAALVQAHTATCAPHLVLVTCQPTLVSPPRPNPRQPRAVGVRLGGALADLLRQPVLLPVGPGVPPDRRLLHPLVDQVSDTAAAAAELLSRALVVMRPRSVPMPPRAAAARLLPVLCPCRC